MGVIPMDGNDRRKKLLNIAEKESYKLPLSDWYDRIRFLREKEAHAYVQEIKRVQMCANVQKPKEPITPIRSFKDLIYD